MSKFTIMLLFSSAILVFFSNYYRGDELTPVYIAVLILIWIPTGYLHKATRERATGEAKARALMQEAYSLSLARKEAKSKIPKNSPRRDSPAACEGSTKLGAVRSMAVLVRKPRLREKILEICEFGDVVLETIRRMPADTPAAVAFSETHLSRLSDALEHCFEMYRSDEYKKAASVDTDTYEIECFSAFITLFCKQQDGILFEGFSQKGGKEITA